MLIRQHSSPRLVTQKITETRADVKALKRATRSLQTLEPLTVDTLRRHQDTVTRTTAQIFVSRGMLTRAYFNDQYNAVYEKVRDDKSTIHPVTDQIFAYANSIRDETPEFTKMLYGMLQMLINCLSITTFIKIIQACEEDRKLYAAIMNVISRDPVVATGIYETIKSWTSDRDRTRDTCLEVVADSELELVTEIRGVHFHGDVSNITPNDVKRALFLHFVVANVEIGNSVYAPETTNAVYYYAGLFGKLGIPCSADVFLETTREGEINTLIGEVKTIYSENTALHGDPHGMRQCIYTKCMDKGGIALKTLTLGYWQTVDATVRAATPAVLTVVAVRGVAHYAIGKSHSGYKTRQRKRYLYKRAADNLSVCEIEFELRTKITTKVKSTISVYAVKVYPAAGDVKLALVDALLNMQHAADAVRSPRS